MALTVEDLHLLETMTTTNEVDYVEIDRILNGMFTVEKKLFSGFQRTNYFVETYQVLAHSLPIKYNRLIINILHK